MSNDQEVARLAELGKTLAQLLNLKKTRAGLYVTDWGTKSDEGLGRAVARLVQESDASK